MHKFDFHCTNGNNGPVYDIPKSCTFGILVIVIEIDYINWNKFWYFLVVIIVAATYFSIFIKIGQISCKKMFIFFKEFVLLDAWKKAFPYLKWKRLKIPCYSWIRNMVAFLETLKHPLAKDLCLNPMGYVVSKTDGGVIRSCL